MTDYEIDIRSFDVAYGHTLARQAGRDVRDGFEIDLRSVTVVVALKYRDGGDYMTRYFEAEFRTDHGADELGLNTIGDPHEKRHAFRPDQIEIVKAVATDVVASWMDDVGLRYEISVPGGAVEGPAETSVHTDLEVRQ